MLPVNTFAVRHFAVKQPLQGSLSANCRRPLIADVVACSASRKKRDTTIVIRGAGLNTVCFEIEEKLNFLERTKEILEDKKKVFVHKRS